ncbi:MAG: hypothetical protein KAJ16_06255, partial [Calditrichia bacterium]|nr:hypothetical protein [Calditrichia bacterium]
MNHQYKFNSFPLHIVGFCFFAVLFICLTVPVQAQLSGTYTIGSGGNYATFTAAVTDLNSLGVNGAVTFDVLAGTYTEQFEMVSVSGASSSNTITFQSQTGMAADVIVQFTASSAGNNYIVRLNGADFITFQNMTFTALGTSYGRIM